MIQTVLSFTHAVLPENGEDCFAVVRAENGIAACVADGCGGLGSRRYPDLDNHTGAYAASRLAAKVFTRWAEANTSPETFLAGKSTLEEQFQQAFRETADKRCTTQGVRIVGSMQRRLPTTFCSAVTDEEAVAFLWAGDSRGYVLDASGLHQCTRDHLKGETDPFENLYLDRPLSRYLSADTEMVLDHIRKPLPESPCAVLLATDGVYSAFPTPMEMEMLLWDTLKAASSWDNWNQKLKKAIANIAQDDATLVVIPCRTESFAAFSDALLSRREVLQKQFITPVRRKKDDLTFARECWQKYREQYDWTEAERHG